MNIFETINRFKRLIKPISPANQPIFINNYDEDDFQECHNPWLALSNCFSKNQDKI